MQRIFCRNENDFTDLESALPSPSGYLLVLTAMERVSQHAIIAHREERFHRPRKERAGRRSVSMGGRKTGSCHGCFSLNSAISLLSNHRWFVHQGGQVACPAASWRDVALPYQVAYQKLAYYARI